VVWTAVAWLMGTCALLLQAQLPQPRTVGAFLAACALAATLTRRGFIVGLALGYACAWVAAQHRLDARLAVGLERVPLTLHGRVASVPIESGDGLRFRVATDQRGGVPALVELSWYEPEFRPLAAEPLELDVRLRRPRGFANPGGTDYEARVLREGVGASGYVRRARRDGRHWSDIASSPVLVARDSIAGSIRATLGERPAAGIVTGLAVGLQDALSREQWRDLARSGTSHLMAISGMHIGLFGLVAGWVAGRLQRLRQRRGAQLATRDVAVACGSTAALAYSCLAGWSVPAQRTALMILIAAIALLGRRRISGADALALGAIAVLAWDPLAPLAVGFWLSFGAVAAILFVVTGHVQRPSPLRAYLRTQWAVSAGLIPVLAGSFGSLSLVALGVNLLAIPLYTLVIVPGVLMSTALLLVVPNLGAPALRAVAWLIEATWPLIAVPAAWGAATWPIAGLPPIAWCLMVLGSVAALAPLPAVGRLCGLLLLLAACTWRPALPNDGSIHFALLDVGQGLAAVIETRRHVLVYDTGPAFRSGGDAGAMAVGPYLLHRGRRRIDLLVVSHDDLDHAGGAGALLRSFEVGGRTASGRALDDRGVATRCRRGQRWRWDGVDFEWLHPGPAPTGRDNDRSCVLLVRAGRHAVLLPGDIERGAEDQLVDSLKPGPVDIVVVPHHGSRTSSTAAFVAATRPGWALVAAGHGNRWGFPREEVVRRWRRAGARILVTSATGAIEFDIGPATAIEAPRLWRDQRRRWWHER
jgi:competence protein ComEC